MVPWSTSPFCGKVRGSPSNLTHLWESVTLLWAGPTVKFRGWGEGHDLCLGSEVLPRTAWAEHTRKHEARKSKWLPGEVKWVIGSSGDAPWKFWFVQWSKKWCVGFCEKNILCLREQPTKGGYALMNRFPMPRLPQYEDVFLSDNCLAKRQQKLCKMRTFKVTSLESLSLWMWPSTGRQ